MAYADALKVDPFMINGMIDWLSKRLQDAYRRHLEAKYLRVVLMSPAYREGLERAGTSKQVLFISRFNEANG